MTKWKCGECNRILESDDYGNEPNWHVCNGQINEGMLTLVLIKED